MVHTLSPNVLMALNSHGKTSTLRLLGGRFNNSIRLWTHDVLLSFCQRTLIQLVITSASLVRTALQRKLLSAPDSAKYTTKACKIETLGMQSLELLPCREDVGTPSTISLIRSHAHQNYSVSITHISKSCEDFGMNR